MGIEGQPGGPAGPRGHRLLPHTADLRLLAWAPTRDGCVAEAVLALVDSFADTTGSAVRTTVTAPIGRDDDGAVLLAALDEVIYLLDADGLVPVTAAVEREGGPVRLVLGVTDLARTRLTGPAPKGAARSALRFERTPGGWSCEVTVDV